MTEALVAGPEMAHLDSSFDEPKDFYFPTHWQSTDGWGVLELKHLGGPGPGTPPPVGSRIGGTHLLVAHTSERSTNFGTNHPFSNTSPVTGDWVWYSFHHYLGAIDNETDGDDVFVAHFRQQILVNGTWLAVTMEINAPGTPAVFSDYEYEVVKVVQSGGAMTASVLNQGALKTAAAYSAEAWHWIQVGVQYKGATTTRDLIQLWVDGVSIGTSSDTDIGFGKMAEDGYISPDSITAAGKGATLAINYFSDLVSNDDKTPGLSTRPGISVPPYWRAPAPRMAPALA